MLSGNRATALWHTPASSTTLVLSSCLLTSCHHLSVVFPAWWGAYCKPDCCPADRTHSREAFVGLRNEGDLPPCATTTVATHEEGAPTPLAALEAGCCRHSPLGPPCVSPPAAVVVRRCLAPASPRPSTTASNALQRSHEAPGWGTHCHLATPVSHARLCGSAAMGDHLVSAGRNFVLVGINDASQPSFQAVYSPAVHHEHGSRLSSDGELFRVRLKLAKV